MAEGSSRACQSASHGLDQRPGAEEPVVQGRSQHGERVAHPAQPPTGQRGRPRGGSADVEVVRFPSGGHRRHQSKSRQEKRLASVGDAQSDCRESLHPETEQKLVICPRPQGGVSTANVLQLLRHQEYRCALTGRKLTPSTAALDHIVPVKRGGEHTIDNSQILHKDVNRAKGSLTAEEFIGLCREVATWCQ